MSQKQKKPVEVVVFTNPYKKKADDAASSSRPFSKGRNKSKSQSTDNDAARPENIYDQKTAKYDVRKLAIHNMKKTEKDKAMVDLLVELGAKRPANKCLHPRDYMEQLKRKREEEKEEELASGNVKKKKTRKQNRRGKDDLLGFVDGQKGRFKDGVQYVNSK